MDDLDRVERFIDISAGVERVWDLVSRPGWWVNDGEIIDHPVDREGDLYRVRHPARGEYQILIVKLEPPTYAAFRWRSDGEIRSVDGPTTLVEFWLDDHGDGTVTVRVVESGFEGLDVAEDVRRASRDGNDRGWCHELGALVRALA